MLCEMIPDGHEAYLYRWHILWRMKRRIVLFATALAAMLAIAFASMPIVAYARDIIYPRGGTQAGPLGNIVNQIALIDASTEDEMVWHRQYDDYCNSPGTKFCNDKDKHALQTFTNFICTNQVTHVIDGSCKTPSMQYMKYYENNADRIVYDNVLKFLQNGKTGFDAETVKTWFQKSYLENHGRDMKVLTADEVLAKFAKISSSEGGR